MGPHDCRSDPRLPDLEHRPLLPRVCSALLENAKVLLHLCFAASRSEVVRETRVRPRSARARSLSWN